MRLHESGLIFFFSCFFIICLLMHICFHDLFRWFSFFWRMICTRKSRENTSALTLFLPAMGGISPYMSVTWQQPVEIGLTDPKGTRGVIRTGRIQVSITWLRFCTNIQLELNKIRIITKKAVLSWQFFLFVNWILAE